jgi:malonyl-CoA O-methyltransferase
MSSLKENNSQTLAPGIYAAHAVLANTVGEEMLQRLDWVKLEPRLILDVGCGTGNFTQKLQERYPAAQVLGTDVAYPMVNFAGAQASSANFCCADATVLPLKNNSVDLIFANLVLPWCYDVKKVLQEWRRVLHPQGLLVFTSLGPDTLSIWLALLKENIIPLCVDMHDIGDALTQGKFADPVLDVDYLTLTYRNCADFCRELEATGILLPVDDTWLLTTDEFKALPQERFAATFEVIYGHAWRPDLLTDQTADEHGVVSIPLAHLRRR